MRTVIFILALVGAVFFVQYKDQQVQEQTDSLYCVMVDAFKQNPQYGWPDYKGTYSEQCLK